MTEQYKNQAITTLASGINESAEYLNLTDATGFPTSGDFRIVIDDEILICHETTTGDDWTVTRGAEDTTPAAHESGASVAHVLTVDSLVKAVEQNTELVNDATPELAGDLDLKTRKIYTSTTNQHIIVEPNGTGGFQLDSTGNTRGTRSVDLQRSRTTSDQVAAGDGTVILGGARNKATGQYAITGGIDCVAAGAESIALGTGSETQSLATGAVTVGTQNIASGQFGIALGKLNTASGYNTVALGQYAHAYNHGHYAIANYHWDYTRGSCQRGNISLALETTDSYWQLLSTSPDWIANFELTGNKTLLFELSIVAVRTDTGHVAAWDLIRGVLQRFNNTVRIVGNYVKEAEHNQTRNVGDEIPPQLVDEITDGASPVIKIETTAEYEDDDLRIYVKGVNLTLRWHCNMKLTEIGSSASAYGS